MPSASRKVSRPDSFEIPAPVRITIVLSGCGMAGPMIDETSAWQ
jgi:hypothetical protein